MSNKTGYFLCMDILGFSKIIESISHEALQQKFDAWISLVDSAAAKHNITYSIFSDTIFAAPGPNLADLKKLIEFCRELLSESIKLSLPLRGAISYGKYHWGKSIYGAAVRTAHELEIKQNWIGVVLDSSIPEIPNYLNFHLICYAVPLQRNDLMKLYPAIFWDIPDFDTLKSYLTSGGLGGTPGKGEALTWHWGEKFGNTVLFRNYTKGLVASGKDPSKFYGIHPIEFLDRTVIAMYS